MEVVGETMTLPPPTQSDGALLTEAALDAASPTLDFRPAIQRFLAAQDREALKESLHRHARPNDDSHTRGTILGFNRGVDAAIDALLGGSP